MNTHDVQQGREIAHENARGISLLQKSVRDFFRTKGFLRIFDGFFFQTKGFLPKAYEIFWSEMPLVKTRTLSLRGVTNPCMLYGNNGLYYPLDTSFLCISLSEIWQCLFCLKVQQLLSMEPGSSLDEISRRLPGSQKKFPISRSKRWIWRAAL